MTLSRPGLAEADLSGRKSMQLYHHPGGVTDMSRHEGVKAMPHRPACSWYADEREV